MSSRAADKDREGRRSSRVTQAAAEQDRAAGGRDRRRVRLGSDVTAIGSIELKRPWKPSAATYAYLRYSQGGRTVTRYVGKATATTREEALRLGWELAHSKGLLDQRPQ
jgi:DNA mismatch endonuclease (patch repair protein)